MIYQRENWHSGLTYQQVCGQCKNTIRYQDNKLDFRPWFPNGFVYCPICKKPLRHSEDYAIDGPRNTHIDITEKESEADTPLKDEPQTVSTRASFCVKCGKAFGADDNYCSGCGAKRE